MPNVVNFYMDDSGARHPDHKPGMRPAHGHDWFALGGVLIKSEDETEARRLHADFLKEWKIECPIHSVEVRGRNQGFLWLNEKGKAEQIAFYEGLYQMMKGAPVGRKFHRLRQFRQAYRCPA